MCTSHTDLRARLDSFPHLISQMGRDISGSTYVRKQKVEARKKYKSFAAFSLSLRIFFRFTQSKLISGRTIIESKGKSTEATALKKQSLLKSAVYRCHRILLYSSSYNLYSCRIHFESCSNVQHHYDSCFYCAFLYLAVCCKYKL